MLAPIVLFTYNRLEHTRQTIEALQKNVLSTESDLIIYSDAPKSQKQEKQVADVRQYLKTIRGFKTTTVIERRENWGLANSVIDGVTDTCNRFGKVIVLEDDLVISPYFLKYMNDSLDLYANESRVMQVSGYMFPLSLKSECDTFLLPLTTSWGWATWQRAWSSFDPSAAEYVELKKNKFLRKKFNLDDSYPYFEMLEAQLSGKIDSWAIRWYLSVFMHQGLVLFPKKSLVLNNGWDGSGTHCKAIDDNSELTNVSADMEITVSPIRVQVSSEALEQTRLHMRLSNSNNLISKFKRFVHGFAKRLSY